MTVPSRRKKHDEGFLYIPVSESQTSLDGEAARSASRQGWLEESGS